MFVLTKKRNVYGEVTRFKARLVVNGSYQRPGVDYGNTYAPVSEKSTLRLILALAAKNEWQVHHLDVTAFLYGDLQEEI